MFLKEDNLESSGKYGKDQAEGQLERETPKTSERQEYERQSKNVFFQYYLTLSDLPQQTPFKIQFYHFSYWLLLLLYQAPCSSPNFPSFSETKARFPWSYSNFV